MPGRFMRGLPTTGKRPYLPNGLPRAGGGDDSLRCRLAGLVDIPEQSGSRRARSSTRSTTEDGVALRYARWPPNRSPVRGTVVILHGRTEFIEKYFETINDLRRRGFAVATFDSRGQGGSARLLGNPRKGHVRDFADHVNDFETVMQEVVLPDCPPPYYVLAHSTGAAVALLSAERLRTQIDRMVLTAPLLALAHGSPQMLAQLTGFLMHFGLGEAFSPGAGATLMQTQPFDGNLLTSDPVRYQRVARDRRRRSGDRHRRRDDRLGQCRHARLLRDGGAGFRRDRADAGADRARRRRQRRSATLRRRSFRAGVKTAAHLRIPGARHEILMEQDQFRDQFWVAFDAFIAGRS